MNYRRPNEKLERKLKTEKCRISAKDSFNFTKCNVSGSTNCDG